MKKLHYRSTNTIGFLAVLLFILFISFGCHNDRTEPLTYGWFDFVIPDLDTTHNAVDMSFLNPSPAGAQGWVTVKDSHFVDGGGTPIRFFGTNLTFSSAFPDKETATNIAARLSKMGYNVVRFHHMDMRKAPDGIWQENMMDFDEGQLDKLDWLIFQLKQKGIYADINLHVSRNYPGSDYTINNFNFGKGIDQFYRPYIDMQREYANRILTHVNKYTGTKYVDEPAVAFVEINNENSLLSNWRLLPQLNRDHSAALIKHWNNWLGKNPDYNQLRNGKSLFQIIEGYDSLTSDDQKKAMWAFLLNTEMSYAQEMATLLKIDLKVRSLVSESQASYSGIGGVWREAQVADYIDMHAYWEHPQFPNTSWSRTDWLIRNSSMVSDKKAGTLLRFGQHRVEGMPLTISEYDHPAPNFFCAEMYPMLNSIAAFQGWDGIYHFTFDRPYEQGKIGGFFSSSGHPLKQVFLPIGAVMFRMNGVKQGQNMVQLQIPEREILNQLVKHGNLLRLHGSNMDKIWEEAGGSYALPVMNPFEVKFGGESLQLSTKIEEPSGIWQGETGEIIWDNTDSLNATFLVNSPYVKSTVGYIGGKRIDLGGIAVSMDSTPYNWACISLATLDGKSITESSKMLLVVAGRAENADMGWNEARTTVGDKWGASPTKVEGIPVRIGFSNMKSLKVSALDPEGNVSIEIPVYGNKKEQRINLDSRYKTLWFLIEQEQ